MRARFSMAEKGVEEIQLTICMTMPVKEWRAVRERLDTSHWPMNEVWSTITDGLQEIDGLADILIEGKDS